jgi:BirA family biotin operon repressor/biotin-[acetyl-CoA-carboxylase] ligase
LPPLAAKSTIGQPFIELSVVESTNIYAMEQIKANLAVHGMAIFAHRQIAGKGQRGKNWVSEPGNNLIISVILDCSFLLLSNPFPLNVLAGLAGYDFFNKYALEETTIKWPNDIYWRDRKAGGILIENQIKGSDLKWSIVGIGININQVNFPISLVNPVSLKQISGKEYNSIEMANELCSCLEYRYQQLQAGGFTKMLEEYNQKLYKVGKEVTLKKGNILFKSIIDSISHNGELLVSGEKKESFRFGEVEWVGNKEQMNIEQKNKGL